MKTRMAKMTTPDPGTGARPDPRDDRNPRARPTPPRGNEPTSTAAAPSSNSPLDRPPSPTPRDAARTNEQHTPDTDALPTSSAQSENPSARRTNAPQSRIHVAPSRYAPNFYVVTTRPLCIVDAYVAERQKFNLLFLPEATEPLKFRLLDDLLNALTADDYKEIELHSYSFVARLTILHIRRPGELRPWYDAPLQESD